MIPARKSRWFNAWFAGHATRRLERSFAAVFCAGLPAVQAVAGRVPLLIVSNHTSWWDPLVALWLGNRVLRVDGYAMMDEANLRRLPFFGKVGAFGVDLASPGAGAESIRYATSLLASPERMVWIFAQGTERPVTLRPLGFRRGSAVIATAVPEIQVVPLGIRYEFGNQERPYLFLSFGAPRAVTTDDVAVERDTQEREVTAALDGIEARIHLGHGRAVQEATAEDWPALMRHRGGALARASEWMLARMTGGGRRRRGKP